jgi:outer membrane protein assembly factor BamB
MSKHKLKLIVSLMTVLLFACPGKKEPDKKQGNNEAAYWPIFRGDAGLSGTVNDKITDKPSLRWTFQTGGEIFSSPAIGSGRVYIGSTDGKYMPFI